MLGLSPVIPISGVFFPVWIFCALGGVLVSVVLREVVIAVAGGPVAGLGALFHTAVALLVGVGGYLAWTGGL